MTVLTLALKHASLGIAMGNAAPATKVSPSGAGLSDGKFRLCRPPWSRGCQVITNIERWWRTCSDEDRFQGILLGVVFGLFGWVFPFPPRQYSTADFLIVGASSFALTLLPNPRRHAPGFLRRAELHGSELDYCSGHVATGDGRFAVDAIGDIRQVQTASFITLVMMGLWEPGCGGLAR